MTKILVTGGGGLLGYALKEICPEAKFVNHSDYDLTDICQTKKLFEKYRPENVLHCAAKVAGVKTNAEKNPEMFAVNVQINTNVLSIAAQFKVKKLVSVLSNCVFQDSPTKPLNEDDMYFGLPYEGHLGYGFAKRMLDIQTKLLSKHYGSEYTSITPVTMFGPNDNWDPNDGHVVGALIYKCYQAKKNSMPLEVWGTGNAVRQFVYSFDVARIMVELLKKKFESPETVIVTPDPGTSIRTLVETIVKVMNFKGQITYNTSKPEGQNVRVLKSNRFQNLFPGFHFTPFEEALQNTVDWFLKNYKKS